MEWTSEVDENTMIIDVATVPLLDMATTSEQITFILYWIGYVLPNVLWLSDALTQQTVISSPTWSVH